MPHPAGEPKTPGSGRKPGTPNKVTAEIKEMVEEALRAEGGIEYLRQVARDDPKAFCALVGKIIPKNIKISGGLTLEEIVLGKSKGDEVEPAK